VYSTARAKPSVANAPSSTSAMQRRVARSENCHGSRATRADGRGSEGPDNLAQRMGISRAPPPPLTARSPADDSGAWSTHCLGHDLSSQGIGPSDALEPECVAGGMSNLRRPHGRSCTRVAESRSRTRAGDHPAEARAAKHMRGRIASGPDVEQSDEIYPTLTPAPNVVRILFDMLGSKPCWCAPNDAPRPRRLAHPPRRRWSSTQVTLGLLVIGLFLRCARRLTRTGSHPLLDPIKSSKVE
jgi:hypothetical protein